MTAIRIAISVFILVIVGVLVRGLIWTSAHQPPSQALASRVVLALGTVGCLVGLAALWRPRRGPSEGPHVRRS